MDRQKKIMFLIMVPWLLAAPLLIYFEVKKLYLMETIKYDTRDRQNFYLKKAMPGLEDDYFELLGRAGKYLYHKRLKYGIYVSSSLPPYVSLMVRNYIVFALSPARPTNERAKMSFKFFYRVRPPDSAGEIVEIISGSKPSYIVRCVIK